MRIEFENPPSRSRFHAALALAGGLILLAAAPTLRAQATNPQTPTSQLRTHKVSIAMPLMVYVIDVEGGQSTLFVTPHHHSLLVDTGWADNNDRDADRIVAAAKAAGLDRIDYVLITHFHEDHVGGVPNLAKKIPIGAFIDHGVNREPDEATQQAWDLYTALIAQTHAIRIIAKPGMQIHLGDVTVTIVSADGNLIDSPLPGAGSKNPACEASPTRPADQSENAHSVGIVLQYGKTRLVDLGDLTWDKEMQLMCPINKLGQMDVYIVSHHGRDQSGSPAFLDGIAPRVAIMDNGEHKGGMPSAWEIIEKSPRLQNLWQLHYSAEGGEQHNVASEYIANLKGTDPGNYIRVSAFPDGKLIVFNSRTGQAKTYLTNAATRQ